MRTIGRRELIAVLGSAAAMWPLAARAQQAAMPIVGFLNNTSAGARARHLLAFHQGLKDAGYVEGQNVTIEYRWADGDFDKLPSLAADLVGRQVAVIAATGGDPSALAAKSATTTIPIVINSGTDPVKLGLVGSLNHPGANITGVSILSAMLVVKQLELLSELVPEGVISFLVNASNPNAEEIIREVQEATRVLGRQLRVDRASTDKEVQAAFDSIAEDRTGALLIHSDPVFLSHADQIVALAARYKVPASYPFREYATTGGLMSYGSSLTDAYRQVAIYTGRILKGEKPADLPIMQAVKIEFVINLSTAKALGLTFPITLLGRADEVIE